MSETRITFFDVGHGSCAHVQTPNGKNILVDVGGSDDFSPAYHLAYVDRIGVLDTLVITHPHEDHYHDIMNLEKYGIKPITLLRHKRGFPIDGTDFPIKDRCKVDYINKMNNNYNETVSELVSPLSSFVNGGLSWKTFFADDADLDKTDPNTFSGIYVLNFGGCKIILTGDNNKEILAKMVKNSEFAAAVKDAHFLLAPHHGRTTDFCPEFFEAVNPAATIISDKCCEHDSQVDSANAYNNGRGIWLNGEIRHVLTTRKDGNIVLRITDQGNFSISNWKHKD
ncbi:MAG: MBL fold metallo-hydrolase [Alphaproteobacteria bacterium]|nr:MBL fold metallo-hydrolase [Alphaproteobacteria bacterium]